MTLAPEDGRSTDLDADTTAIPPSYNAARDGQLKLFEVGPPEWQADEELHFPLTAVVDLDVVGHRAVEEPDLPVINIALYDRDRGIPIVEISPQPGRDRIAESPQEGMSILVATILGRWDTQHADLSQVPPAAPDAYIEGVGGDHTDSMATAEDLKTWAANQPR